MRPLFLASVSLAFATLAAIQLGSALPARAQANPNADQIVKALTPAPSGPGTTRGIRVGHPEPPPSVNLNILFATGSADLTPGAMQTLAELGQALNNPALAGSRFRIEGHTDTVGAPDANKALSDRRAAAVAAFLAQNYHIDYARLQPVGMGEDGLLVPTPDQTPELRNRRVLVVNIGS
jgi:OOP family OmpA-OmpF porin